MATSFRGLKLSSLVLVAVLSACAVPGPASRPAEQPQTSAALVGGEWVAFAIQGVPEVVTPKPKLRWLVADQVTGTGGCNGFKGRSSANLSTLQLGPLASTGRACLSMPGSQEDLYFKALELTRKARIERDQLILLDDAGKQLVRFLRPN
ncbi:MAG: META domain-containing protein [Burkholderiales bacterium]|nr:META domain-containing protein [Burkholderiales bacterium]